MPPVTVNGPNSSFSAITRMLRPLNRDRPVITALGAPSVMVMASSRKPAGSARSRRISSVPLTRRRARNQSVLPLSTIAAVNAPSVCHGAKPETSWVRIIVSAVAVPSLLTMMIRSLSIAPTRHTYRNLRSWPVRVEVSWAAPPYDQAPYTVTRPKVGALPACV